MEKDKIDWSPLQTISPEIIDQSYTDVKTKVDACKRVQKDLSTQTLSASIKDKILEVCEPVINEWALANINPDTSEEEFDDTIIPDFLKVLDKQPYKLQFLLLVIIACKINLNRQYAPARCNEHVLSLAIFSNDRDSLAYMYFYVVRNWKKSLITIDEEIEIV